MLIQMHQLGLDTCAITDTQFKCRRLYSFYDGERLLSFVTPKMKMRLDEKKMREKHRDVHKIDGNMCTCMRRITFVLSSSSGFLLTLKFKAFWTKSAWKRDKGNPLAYVDHGNVDSM